MICRAASQPTAAAASTTPNPTQSHPPGQVTERVFGVVQVPGDLDGPPTVAERLGQYSVAVTVEFRRPENLFAGDSP